MELKELCNTSLEHSHELLICEAGEQPNCTEHSRESWPNACGGLAFIKNTIEFNSFPKEQGERAAEKHGLI